MSARDNPFEMIERMFDQMSRQFEEAARTWRTERRGMADEGHAGTGIDLADHDDAFEVTADVPGFEKDDIELRLQDDVLLITASREQETEEREATYLRSEREHRSLTERVKLPESVVEEDIEATLKNGVLTVRLPKAEPAETNGRRIDIE